MAENTVDLTPLATLPDDNKPPRPRARSRAAAPKQPEAATVRLAAGDPVAFFDPSLDGVPTITATGTDVPADRESDIRAAARHAGVTLRKV